ncbi:hypothetical protein BJ912DRAFT_38507 [Pholiota molesta]|nr:hypothetical protein BJ912DRAFT_38507 [Pholiota molesta]
MPRVELNFASISCYQANESGPRRIFYTAVVDSSMSTTANASASHITFPLERRARFSTPSATYNASQGHRSRIRRRRWPAVPTPPHSPSLSTTTILGVRDGDMSTMSIVPCCGVRRWLQGNINRLATHRRQPQWRSRPPNLSTAFDTIRTAIATDDDIEDDDDRAPPLRHP